MDNVISKGESQIVSGQKSQRGKAIKNKTRKISKGKIKSMHFIESWESQVKVGTMYIQTLGYNSRFPRFQT